MSHVSKLFEQHIDLHAGTSCLSLSENGFVSSPPLLLQLGLILWSMVVINRQPSLMSTESMGQLSCRDKNKTSLWSSLVRCFIADRTRLFRLRGSLRKRCCVLLLVILLAVPLSIRRHQLVQTLNILLGKTRTGQGLEVRAVLPLNIHPSWEQTNRFAGGRCLYRSRGLFRRHSSFVCEECSIEGQCSLLHPYDRTCRYPLVSVVATSVTSQYKRDSNEAIAFMKVKRDRQPEYNFHPICSMEACWNLTKCNARNDSDELILTVHVKGSSSLIVESTVKARLENTIRQTDSIQAVDDADHACLVVIVLFDGVKLDDVDSFPQNGQNVLLWDLANLDAEDQHYGKAAIASRNGLQPWMRLGYDIILPLRQVKKPIASVDPVHLLSIADSAYDLFPQWVAYQFWQNHKRQINLVARPSCPTKTKTSQLLAELVNSTFTLFGDGSPSLYQILLMGSIPVVARWETLPFWPEVAWDRCAIQVDLKRIVDLPKLLSGLTAMDIFHRRERCKIFSRLVFGDDGYDHDIHSLNVALSVVQNRIRRALDLRESLETLTNNLMKNQ